jgi:type II restriction/modification system DNA methylase subunit YeeA
MELHDYLDHGYRVLSNRSGSDIPEVLEQAVNVDLPGLNKEKVMELRLAGDKDNELYRILIVAQCNALHRAMPFLFESINNETELLLPDNLLHSNSPIRKMVNEVDEELWSEIEIIGWIYQFYISEKKDQVIGKVVNSEDIPAATQLFTPNWIVKYMVQNTLGRQWLATYPASPLRDRMEYYIEPAEQEPDVQRQLDEITPDQLDQECLTVLDPACGSGHILIEAYELFKAIYLERGYRTRDIPSLILKKNLYGLDIDDRASQLAAFSLMMKARADDRQIFDRNVRPNVFAIQESRELDAVEIARAVVAGRKADAVSGRAGQRELFPVVAQQDIHFEDKAAVLEQDIDALLGLFENGKTYGSLITVPEEIAEKLPFIGHTAEECLRDGPELSRKNAENLLPFVRQAELLARQYDVVVANPPYMGSKYLNPILKNYLKANYKGYEKDLFSAFIIRNRSFSKTEGQLGFMSPFVWMFISSYENLRKTLIDEATLTTLIQLEYSGFAGATVPICTFTFMHYHCDEYVGSFIRLSDFRGAENQAPKTLEAINNHKCGWFYTAKLDDFKKIPGSPIAYWVSDRVREVFSQSVTLKSIGDTRQGMATSDNNRFVRCWHEVSRQNSCIHCKSHEEAEASDKKWFPYNKGGEFRKWYGNAVFFVNWENGGQEILDYASSLYGSATRTIKSISEYFKPCISWSKISSSALAMRFYPQGFIFDVAGCSIFSPSEEDLLYLLGYSNTGMVKYFLTCISPTLNFEAGQVAQLPILKERRIRFVVDRIQSLVNHSNTDWDSYETSWDFTDLPLLRQEYHAITLDGTYVALRHYWHNIILEMQHLEEENNRIFIDAYGLQDELTPDVPLEQITLNCNPHYCYGSKLSVEEQEIRLREDTIKELISYAIGCMMGRYSLDEPGLIYANSGNQGFDSSRYKTFPADDDGIIPIMDLDWFPDDAANRFVEFLRVAWSLDILEDNLKFVAGSLKPKRGETPTDTIRRYLSTNFFKDHLKTYKKRPIYWMFSSGKLKAFECLVYLHRYNEATLSRMRNSYVTPLQGKFNARIEYLRNEIDAATTASAQKKMQKGLDSLKKKQAELSMFDEKLRHYADKRIEPNLDDGVKVNYGKFGDLLAEKKAVTGKK